MSGSLTFSEHFVVLKTADAKKVVDIDQKVKNFIEKLERQHNTKASWWDLYGKSGRPLGRAGDDKKYKVWAKADPMHYGEPLNSSKKEVSVYKNRFRNEQRLHDQKVTLQVKRRRMKYASWHSTKSIRIGANVRASLSLHGIFNLNAGFHYNYDLASGESHMEMEEVEFTIKKEITIPRRTTVEVEWITTEHYQRYPWKSDVLLDGWFVLWFEKRVHNHHLWFHPVDVIKDDDFELHDPSGLVCTTEGIADGVTLITNELKVREYPLETGNITTAPVNITTEPLTENEIEATIVNSTSLV
ncbi:hypothetical protein MTO96_013148 [Rhipicephalus appendiculatus]